MLKQQAKFFDYAKRFIDVFLIVITGYIAYFIKFHHMMITSSNYHFGIFFGSIIGFFTLYFLGTYKPFRARSFFAIASRIMLAWVLLILIWGFLAFYTKTGARFSREWAFYWMLLSFATVIGFRFIIMISLRTIRKKGHNIRQVLILGAGDVAENLLSRLGRNTWTGYKVHDVFDDNPEKIGTLINGFTIKKIPEQIYEYTNKNNIDEIWLALPISAYERIKTLIADMNLSTADIRIVPDIYTLGLINHSITEIAGIPTINVRSSPMNGENRFLKAIEDRIIASLILVCVSPILLIVAIAVKLSSPGPIFYRQERISWNNKKFNMLKFRSMPVNVETKSGAAWAKAGENRATKVGNFLRKTSLDELPQFINVLKGDMSVVGPRPERPIFVEQFKKEIPKYMQKHMVKAGITGWAQINGWRGDTDLKKRIEYDIYYIEHWSLKFDLKIIWMTIFKGFVNKNAY